MSNKFDYGNDQNGGSKAGKSQEDAAEIKSCLLKSAVGHAIGIENKELIERQNFTIQHDKML